MKYTVKLTVFKLANINVGEKDANGNPLPQELATQPSYRVVTDISASGSLTPTALKAELKKKHTYPDTISDKLYLNGVEITGSAAITDTWLSYDIVTKLEDVVLIPSASIPDPEAPKKPKKTAVSGSVSGSI